MDKTPAAVVEEKKAEVELVDLPVPVVEDIQEQKTKMLPFEPLTGAEFDETRVWRYSLWRKLRKTGKTILWIGLNPSTADESVDDPTVHRMVDYSWRWGFAMVYVANIFAYRSTDPRPLRDIVDPVGAENNRWIARLRKQSDLCICAWGNWARVRNRGDEVLKLLEKYGPLHCMGLNKTGYPKHPLYLRKKLEAIEFKPKASVEIVEPKP
jgi:hypothetical protein